MKTPAKSARRKETRGLGVDASNPLHGPLVVAAGPLFPGNLFNYLLAHRFHVNPQGLLVNGAILPPDAIVRRVDRIEHVQMNGGTAPPPVENRGHRDYGNIQGGRKEKRPRMKFPGAAVVKVAFPLRIKVNLLFPSEGFQAAFRQEFKMGVPPGNGNAAQKPGQGSHVWGADRGLQQGLERLHGEKDHRHQHGIEQEGVVGDGDGLVNPPQFLPAKEPAAIQGPHQNRGDKQNRIKGKKSGNPKERVCGNQRVPGFVCHQ